MTKYEKVIQQIESNPIEISVVLMASFKTYLKTMFLIVNETPIMWEPFMNQVVTALEDLVFGRNVRTNLKISIPVGSGKSLIIEYFLSWCYARDVNNAFLYLSHSDRLITKLSKETKEIVENKHWALLFQKQLKKDDRSKVNWSFDDSKNRTGLFAGTIGGGITGLDAGNPNIEGFSGALIIDDPMDVGKVKYARSREEVVEFYTDKLETRKRTPTTPTILIMQRLHKYDLIGALEDIEPEEWDEVIVPALKPDGTSFWEKRYPANKLKRMKEINPYKFNAQYQQSPISTGGNVIKSSWYKYYQDIKSITLKKLFFTVDTAQKTKEHNDWSVFSLWGTDGNNLYLIDLHRSKWESPELRKNAKIIWNKWKNGIGIIKLGMMYIEDKVSGTGLIQDLQRESSIPVKGVQREKDKGVRLSNVLPYIEAGRVFLPMNENYSFVPKFLSESEEMTLDDTHSFDDQIDTMIDGIEMGIANRKVSILDVL